MKAKATPANTAAKQHAGLEAGRLLYQTYSNPSPARLLPARNWRSAETKALLRRFVNCTDAGLPATPDELSCAADLARLILLTGKAPSLTRRGPKNSVQRELGKWVQTLAVEAAVASQLAKGLERDAAIVRAARSTGISRAQAYKLLSASEEPPA